MIFFSRSYSFGRFEDYCESTSVLKSKLTSLPILNIACIYPDSVFFSGLDSDVGVEQEFCVWTTTKLWMLAETFGDSSD